MLSGYKVFIIGNNTKIKNLLKVHKYLSQKILNIEKWSRNCNRTT